MPYTEATIIASSLACRKASDLWLARIPLHYFDIVEMHFPDRVMQQFGLSQYIRDYVDAGDELHDINRQGRWESNWLLIHAAYLHMWHDRRDHIFMERQPTIDLQSYMRWYMSITRRFITPNLSRSTTRTRTRTRMIYELRQLRQNQLVSNIY